MFNFTVPLKKENLYKLEDKQVDKIIDKYQEDLQEIISDIEDSVRYLAHYGKVVHEEREKKQDLEAVIQQLKTQKEYYAKETNQKNSSGCC